jgi:hypothetical protein
MLMVEVVDDLTGRRRLAQRHDRPEYRGAGRRATPARNALATLIRLAGLSVPERTWHGDCCGVAV